MAQFAPAILGGIFWKRATKTGALSGLIAGFLLWVYTLVLPSLVQAGFMEPVFVTQGPFGVAWLKPFALFGLEDFDHVAHAVFWSLLFNTCLFVGVSLYSRPSAIEHSQATLFVEAYRYAGETDGSSFWRGTASVGDLRSLLVRFLGQERTEEELSAYASRHIGGRQRYKWEDDLEADAGLVNYVEKLLAGTIGSASARVVVSKTVKEEPLGIEEVMDILDETRQVIAYSRELEKASADLRAANERLKELDRLKDEFISTVTHELRTPLTSVRSIAEILHANPRIEHRQHQEFTAIIVKESERLSRLINQVLDFQKIETGRMAWQISDVDLKALVHDALSSTNSLVQEKRIRVEQDIPDLVPTVSGDRDRLIQVMVNLISNAVKFCADDDGRIEIGVTAAPDHVQVSVKDNGIGISRNPADKAHAQGPSTWQWPGADHHAADHRFSWRSNFGGERAWPGVDLFLHPAARQTPGQSRGNTTHRSKWVISSVPSPLFLYPALYTLYFLPNRSPGINVRCASIRLIVSI
ncbi:MAG: histidine kinase dimerization/phospho-acceptor domain-containing protein [Desulfobacterales bacterium]